MKSILGWEANRYTGPQPRKSLAPEEKEASTIGSNRDFQLVTETEVENVMQSV